MISSRDKNLIPILILLNLKHLIRIHKSENSQSMTHILLLTIVFDFISVLTRATCLKLSGIVRESGNTLVIV